MPRGVAALKSKNFRCTLCSGKTNKVYETERNIFLQCPCEHEVPKSERRPGYPRTYHAPAFMIRKMEFEDFSKAAIGGVR
jgi:hypothetical protein